MTSTVLAGLYDKYSDAESAIREIEAAGVAQSDITLLAKTSDGLHELSSHTNAGADADTGATVGAVVGGGAGLLAGLGLLVVPGIGALMAAGWVAATLVGAGVGAGVGASAGSLIGLLTQAGISSDEAHVYAESIRRGANLVLVRVEESRVDVIKAIIQNHSPIDVLERGRQYGGQGWTSFDEHGIPYTAAERDIQRQGNLTDMLT
jgi:hypothetical protein